MFGGDLGHAHYPAPDTAVPRWLRGLEQRVGADTAHAILTTNGRKLLLP